MKKSLFFLIGLLGMATFFILYEIGRAGDLPPAAESTASAPSQLLKGSGSFLSGELKETGEFLLSVQDELETEKRYLMPKGLTIQEGEKEIQPSELQKGDILDIDYLLSGNGERVVTHLDVVIAAKEKETRVEAPALNSASEGHP